MTECEWFDQCHDESIAVVDHPTLGDVEICDRHVQWLTQDLHEDGTPNPTRMVPPIAARSAARMRERLAAFQ